MLVVATAAAWGCGASPAPGAGTGATMPPLPEPVRETCATRIPPRSDSALPAASASPAAPPLVVPRSTIVVEVELPLAPLRQALEGKVPRRVAEERDRDLGRAGRLEYTVDRGPFALRVDGGALFVEAALHGRAQACAKGRCYAGCAPEARITARVPLHLGADYRLRTSDVRIDVTRGCEVRALGGLLTIDVTPVLRGALAHQTRTVQASIDRELPDLRPQATRLWSELEAKRTLPLGACVMLAPEELTQGRASGTAETARLRFGLLARPEVRVRCDDPPASPTAPTAPTAPTRPLPPLRDDPTLPAHGDVFVAIALPGDAPARAVERGEPIDLAGRRTQVKAATGDASVGLALGLAGEVCGDVTMGIGGAAWNDAQSLHLTGVLPAAGEQDRLSVAQVDGARLGAALERASIRLPIAVSSLTAMLPELARGMSDDHVTVGATVESAKPGGAGLRAGGGVIAVAVIRGALTVRAK